MNTIVIYLVYPLLAVALLWGAKCGKRGQWNEEAFSLRQTKALQGFFAICIMLHHIGQKTGASWLKPQYVISHGLSFFVPLGYYFVGFFLFCSGYGLATSLHRKPDYLKGFAKERILPIVLSFYSTGLFFLVVRILIKEPMDPWKIVSYALGFRLSNPNGWFVAALPFFYLFFYLSYRFCKTEKRAFALFVLFVFLYQLLGTIVDHNDWWMCGEWWYNSVHCFVLGVLFEKYQERIVAHLKKHYLLYLILLFFAMFLTYGFSVYAQSRFSYYGENWGAPDKVLRRQITLFSQILASTTFVVFVFMVGMKVRFGNRFLAFMGRITLEFYLIHGLFLELFSYRFDGVAPSLYYLKNVPLLVLVVFLPSIPAALLIQKLHHAILKNHI